MLKLSIDVILVKLVTCILVIKFTCKFSHVTTWLINFHFFMCLFPTVKMMPIFSQTQIFRTLTSLNIFAVLMKLETYVKTFREQLKRLWEQWTQHTVRGAFRPIILPIENLQENCVHLENKMYIEHMHSWWLLLSTKTLATWNILQIKLVRGKAALLPWPTFNIHVLKCDCLRGLPQWIMRYKRNRKPICMAIFYPYSTYFYVRRKLYTGYVVYDSTYTYI